MADAARLRLGTPAFRRAMLGLFAAGFATFALLYCVQPLMPVFSEAFGVSAATSSLSLSLTTGLLAPMLIVAGAVSEAWGRTAMIAISLAATAVLTIAAALMPGFEGLLVMRTLTGVAMSGLPAITMAYLGEEVEPEALGFAAGLMIGGNALGGLAGRLLGGALAEFASWRAALGAVGAFGLVSALVAYRTLPPSRNFRPRPLRWETLAAAFLAHLQEPGLRALVALGFLLMGGFVTLYNYLGYRLLAPPYALGPTAASAIFGVYLVGIVSSASMGRLADRLGRRRVLWAAVLVMLAGALMTLAADLALVILGLAVATFGFFGGHSIASSWVSRRAPVAKGQAASLYFFAYYAGSSVVGWAGGHAWEAAGWPGVVALVGGVLAVAAALALRLARLAPLPSPAG
jgi:MFS transporter, YNFM family, putative membrane transport protein